MCWRAYALAALVAGCSPLTTEGVRGTPQQLASPSETERSRAESYIFWEPYDALDLLVEAARSCGLLDVQISYFSFRGTDRHMLPGVSIPIPSFSSSAFDCTVKWIRDHPETGLSIPE
jgi:hypothetical protein